MDNTIRDKVIAALYSNDVDYLDNVSSQTMYNILHFLNVNHDVYNNFMSDKLFRYLIYKDDLINGNNTILILDIIKLDGLHSKVNITNEDIEYLLDKNNGIIIIGLIQILIRKGDVDGVKLILYHKHNYYDILFYIINYYSEPNNDNYNEAINKRNMLLLALDHDEQYITLDVLYYCSYQIESNNTIQDYRAGNAINYCLSKVITKVINKDTNDKLHNVENGAIEALCINTIEYGAPFYLTELLLRYIPASSSLHNSNYRDQLVRNDIEYDINLFEDDI